MPDNDGFSSYAYAQQLRDIIKKFIQDEVKKIRPDAKYAKVVSVDDAAGVAYVLFGGDVDPVPVRVHSVRPTTVDDVVRVEGTPARRYVTEVIQGVTKLFTDQLMINDPPVTGASPNMYLDPTTGEVNSTSSSRKYKKNIDTAVVSDETIKLLRAVTYIPTTGDEKTYLGVIAEELADSEDPILDKLVNRVNEEPNSVHYDRLGVLLLPVVQRLIARVEDLESKINDTEQPSI